MKKTNQNFKVLSRKETANVKGGGWLSNLFSYWYNRYQEDKAEEEAALAMEVMASAEEGYECPPPEPID